MMQHNEVQIGQRPQPEQQAQNWQQTRLDGIADHHSLTEAAKELDAVAAAHNPGSNHFYYSTFINLIYKELFNLKKGQTRGLRNRLSTMQLKKLQTVERETARWIRDVLATDEDYHRVYYVVQQKVRTLVKRLGKEDVSKREDEPNHIKEQLWIKKNIDDNTEN